MHRHARNILDGNAGQVASTIRRAATTQRFTPAQRQNADTCATYLTNESAYLNYPTALRNGWPIATGVIEGAAATASTTARTSPAPKPLRALRADGDLDDYWTYRLTEEHKRVHQTLRRGNHPPRIADSRRAAPDSIRAK